MPDPDEPTQALPTSGSEPSSDPTWTDDGEPTSEPEARTGRPRLITWVLAAVLVLALIGGITWLVVSTNRANREAAIRDTATNFLTAVADGDAAAALELLADQPANRALLTGEALAVSNQAAALTDIQAGALGGDGDRPTVDVTYRLGDLPVATTLELTGDGRSWKLTDGTGEVVVPERAALTVNGAVLSEETNPVFPGTYTAEPVSDKVALAGTPQATVSTPGQDPARIEVTPGLSELGTQTVLNAVRTRFDECLGATESRPANCPFGVDTTGVEVAPDSVRFVPANDPWAGFAPTLDPATLTAGGTIPFVVNATATVTRDGLTTNATTVLSGERGYNVDLTQDPAVVTWW